MFKRFRALVVDDDGTTRLMLRSMLVTYVILGHSERRTHFGETDETVAKKTAARPAKTARKTTASRRTTAK